MGVDLQRRCLLFRRADHDAVAGGDDRLLLGVAVLAAVVVRRARRGAYVLPLVAKTAGALPDLKAARFAEIVLPGIFLGSLVGFAFAEGLRMRERRGLFQGKADLRIGRQVGVAALFAGAAVGDDVAAWAIGEVGRACRRPLGNAGQRYRCAAATAGRRRRARLSGNARRRDRPRGTPAGAVAACCQGTGSRQHRGRRSG